MSASRKGMTLLEIMVAAGITTIVAAMAMSVVTSGVRIARQGEQTVNSNEAARTGMEMVLRDLRLAGVPGGLLVASSGGNAMPINAVFTQTGATGADDLWMVIPKANGMQSNCTSPGSGAVVQWDAQTLNVNCTSIFQTSDTLVVTNFVNAVLIDGLTFPSSTNISYSQSGALGYFTSRVKSAFLAGDMVMPVDIIRYSVRPNAITGRPELVRQKGHINSSVTATAPFVVLAGAAELSFPDVEDLQVAFGTGTEPNLSFASSNGIGYASAAAPIMAVRVSVVGITPRIIYTDIGTPLPYGPVTVENHVPDGGIDGYRRSVYRRRVELLNMAAVNL